MSEPAKAAFLSYAREDAAAAKRIADALRTFGVEVWFDQSELRGGDAWDTKLRGQIKTCALFMPIVSATTEERSEGYFRREWKLAIDRMQDMGSGKSFIVPVVIDDTREAGADVPEEFLRFQWTRLPGGEATPEFVAQVKKLLELKKPALASGPRPPTSMVSQAEQARKETEAAAPAAPPASRLPLLYGAVALAAISAAVYFALRPAPAAPVVPAPAPVVKAEPAGPVVPAPREVHDKSIAVLPFTNMSEEKENAFFADGVHEDVLTNLALIRELRVVSRTTVQSYRGTAKPMKQIAQELGVTYILEGSVRRSGNKVRVTGQLIHAATDEHVWAASYDRDLTDVFTIQAELSQQIAAALKTALSPEEKILIARRPTENTDAYDLFLRARDIRNRESNNFDSFKRRVALLEQAVALDPSFAQAWGDLGAAYAYAVFLNYDGMDAFLAKAKAAIDRAVRLKPDDFDVISSLGTYYYYGYRDYARATEQYERLARLQPNSPVAFSSLGLIQRRQGRWAESLGNSRRAAELDPANLSYLRNLASTLLAGNRYEEARTVRQRIVALLPDQLPEAMQLAMVSFFATGSTREVDEFFARLTPAQRDSPRGIVLRQSWARTCGDLAEAIRLDRLQPYYDDLGTPRWQQAFAAALDLSMQGDRAAARIRLGDAPAELRKRLELEPTNSRNWGYLAGMATILGDQQEFTRCMERSAQLLPESLDAMDGVNIACYRAYCYGWLGDKERALAEFKRLLRTPNGLWVQNLRAAHFEFAGDPRFEALLNDPKNNAPLF